MGDRKMINWVGANAAAAEFGNGEKVQVAFLCGSENWNAGATWLGRSPRSRRCEGGRNLAIGIRSRGNLQAQQKKTWKEQSSK